MKGLIVILGIISIAVSVYAQSYKMKIIQKDGQQISVVAEAGTKITFAKDRTYALVVSQKDGSDLEAILTGIDRITFNEQTRVDERILPSEMSDMGFILHQNYPNPFNPSTTITYELPSAGWIHIQICNINGQSIRDLEARYCLSGIQRVVWNGEDENRQLVPNGVYLYQVRYNNFSQMKKLLFVK